MARIDFFGQQECGQIGRGNRRCRGGRRLYGGDICSVNNVDSRCVGASRHRCSNRLTA